MSSVSRAARKRQHVAPIFAALGDETRLALLAKLSRGEDASILVLTEGTGLTRQAVSKHLRVLEEAGLVRCRPRGRESRFTLVPQPMERASAYLATMSQQWGAALLRLKAFAEH